MKYLLPVLLADFYKTAHRVQYPEGSRKVFSNWTPRKSRVEGVDHVVSYGQQGFIKTYLIGFFNENFFNRDIKEVVAEYERFIKFTLGEAYTDSSHIRDLHQLGYLPLRIRSIKEGTRVPIGVPMITIVNTIDRFFWLVNYIESVFSSEIWQGMTVATLAYQYRVYLNQQAIETTGSAAGVEFQGHDFSFRGMPGLMAACIASPGHLLSFVGTDTMPAIMYLEHQYNANIEKELVGCSIPATEHSVQCAEDVHGEFDLTKRLITETYPSGLISIVGDTWNLWNFIINILGGLKNEIMARDGKVVCRPDSGDPVDILCGTIQPDHPRANDPDRTPEEKGVIELLWDIFGGTKTEQGFKVLDSHIGAIYGDSITFDRCQQICQRLRAKEFASTNVVFGIGSYTYQFMTRDTLGFAMKATYVDVNGEERLIFKDPITDDGTKKSLKGLISVRRDEKDKLYAVDNLRMDGYLLSIAYGYDVMGDIFVDGEIFNETSLSEIRNTLHPGIPVY